MNILNILGKRRLIVIGVVTAVAAFLAYVSFQYFAPKVVDYTRQNASIQSQINVVQSDYRRAVEEFEMLLKRKDEFQTIIDSNLINNQDRRNARNVLSSVQTDSGIIFAKAAVGVLQKENDDLLNKASFDLNKSPVTIEIQSFDDLDFYEYIHILKNRLPGIVTIDSISMVRERGLSAVLLRQIADGEKPVIMKANVDATWISISPRQSDEDEGGGQ